jgi:hypothetical protein
LTQLARFLLLSTTTLVKTLYQTPNYLREFFIFLPSFQNICLVLPNMGNFHYV